MLPTLEGIIARRILLNFRADPEVVRPHVPAPLEVALQNGFAVIGVCLIRLEKLRPKGLPSLIGLSSENMAHRVAIRYPHQGALKDGVFIWRRDTDQRLISLLGGRLFPGVHRTAEFCVRENDARLAMHVHTENQEADVQFRADEKAGWEKTKLFAAFDDAREFFRKGDCGFSCSLQENKLEGMQLETLTWNVAPLAAHDITARFYERLGAARPGSIEYDCALLMRGIPHRWHELTEIPEFAARRTK
jgi:hypothetical protein